MSHGKRHRHSLHQALSPASLSRFTPGNQITLLQNGEAYFPALEAAFDRARHEIYLETYIYENDATGQHIADALKRAVLRGVRVVLLLQGRVEYLLQHYATRALYGNFLAAGIEIYEYRKSFLHAKVAVIDGHWATVGSSNIDPFSLLLSREANVVVDDEEFCATLTQSLKQTIATDGGRILRDNWKQQAIYLRFMSWLSYGFLRLMMGISGYDSENSRIRNDRTPAKEE
jgi:cardiolipin synthase